MVSISLRFWGGSMAPSCPPHHAWPHVPRHGSRRPALNGGPTVPCAEALPQEAQTLFPQTFPTPRFLLWAAPEAQAVPGCRGDSAGQPACGSGQPVVSCMLHTTRPVLTACLQMPVTALCSIPGAQLLYMDL